MARTSGGASPWQARRRLAPRYCLGRAFLHGSAPGHQDRAATTNEQASGSTSSIPAAGTRPEVEDQSPEQNEK